MLEKEQLDRLNELAKKKRDQKINKDELEELTKLRKEFLTNFRNSFKKQIEQTKVIDPEGNDVTPEKIKEIQEKNKHL
ncbi:MAG TPA: DUF896 domain-containing protein [Jeotgalicoccus sp.]|uniref:UPF0291 protein JEOSCH030_01082 n=1 Tax=Phocicoccus schoeneichii TaxID=1812261 RepID=A0A6V7RH49_9BACL|nr:DUF896 domain-containing protein [Jeotgalicoccus schoeneichii]GGH48836.1 UPF0291 protein [Jeotgalicoccus schoeneichii]CAD2076472.1 hypothetical protein JEOSCH030_01082 [Jeotgalicoccus schoeneichii]HLR39898.1 DUF896 domain-containing protein [Jeotgalicoccus sp.]